jgi:hypothetical protein
MLKILTYFITHFNSMIKHAPANLAYAFKDYPGRLLNGKERDSVHLHRP